MTPPLLSITGKKNSGKTTLVVRLADALTRRGVRVMTIKHGSHTFNMDPVNTDTYRHYHEGQAERVAMISPDKFALVERWTEPLTPQEVAARHMADAGIVLCEGFKATDLPKVEVFRRAAHDAPLYDPTLPNAAAWQAMVSDGPVDGLPFPLFRLDHDGWLGELAAWVERTYLRKGS
ncbi:MAG: molybdopterin-guanine dinucleotide biosynthesis protein B [Gemmatimonadaceae bacterium]